MRNPFGLSNINRPLNLLHAHAKLDKMGKGRKKLPDSVKVLRGTDQPCRSGTEVPGVMVVSSLPKSGLKGTAKKVFEVVASQLIATNVLDVLGVDLVIAYAREMALYHDTMREVEAEGFVLYPEEKLSVKENGPAIEVATKRGVPFINPKRKVAESALSNAKMLAAEFGLTPSSRGRIAALLSNEPPKDDFAEFEEVK